jgi:hypothetical protein
LSARWRRRCEITDRALLGRLRVQAFTRLELPRAELSKILMPLPPAGLAPRASLSLPLLPFLFLLSYSQLNTRLACPPLYLARCHLHLDRPSHFKVEFQVTVAMKGIEVPEQDGNTEVAATGTSSIIGDRADDEQGAVEWCLARWQRKEQNQQNEQCRVGRYGIVPGPLTACKRPV